ncbi:MAG: hypothetical protein QOE65_1122 [Solirubrobacteraceae bacterium]|nr:hypothetical protein [Solirubrobacteraceae bacterium]
MTPGQKILLAMLLFAALTATPAHGAAPVRGSVVISDERTISWIGTPAERAWARARPDARSPVVTRLRWYTEDGQPEVYLALRRWRDDHGRPWLLVRLPLRPNGRKGWVPEDVLAPLRPVRTRLVIDRRALRATLTLRGRRIWSSPVGVGKPGTPTPAGRFWVRERLRGLGGIYGPWAFGTSAYSRLTDWPGGGVVGIHGTNQPELIPGRPSHGCVRLPNPAVRRLARLMPVGTPVLIL